MQVFGTLKVLMAFLGPSWPLLGQSVPKMGPQKLPKSNQKIIPKLIQTCTQRLTKKRLPILSHFWSPDWAQTQPRNPCRAHSEIWTLIFKTLLFSRWPQDGAKWSLDAPRSSQDGARWPQHDPRWPQDGPRWPQDIGQNGPKNPRRLQDAPRWPQDADCPRWLQDGPFFFRMGGVSEAIRPLGAL